MKLCYGMKKALLALILCGNPNVGAFNSHFIFNGKSLKLNHMDEVSSFSKQKHLQTQKCEAQLAFVPTSLASKTALFAKKKKGGGPKGAAAAALAALEDLEQGTGEEAMSKKDQLKAQKKKEKAAKKAANTKKVDPKAAALAALDLDALDEEDSGLSKKEQMMAAKKAAKEAKKKKKE